MLKHNVCINKIKYTVIHIQDFRKRVVYRQRVSFGRKEIKTVII